MPSSSHRRWIKGQVGLVVNWGSSSRWGDSLSWSDRRKRTGCRVVEDADNDLGHVQVLEKFSGCAVAQVKQVRYDLMW